ncbi:hypothetical protein C8R46DRAFT_1201622 [Mycena filopes]|nr:hypothetical protein C8R46DRAFT_1201622 [Mycena filopes]
MTAQSPLRSRQHQYCPSSLELYDTESSRLRLSKCRTVTRKHPNSKNHRLSSLSIPESTDQTFEASNEHMNRLLNVANQQSTRLNTAIERLTKAVEAIKQQTPSTDTKTAFWTAYRSLADEFDKEFQRKHGNDLDTCLIFAGLFSAVSSAFIIQIQPEFQLHSNMATQSLLILALTRNITATPLLEFQNSSLAATPTIVVIAQAFLFVSLFSTLLAALLAVLGKQWLLQYDSVGEKGTIGERALERQRKFDGIRRWKFDLVLQICPLLLQFSLFLFAAALSTYLWTIHHAIAGIVLVLTSLGFLSYAEMIRSAAASPDSPFQNSLSALLMRLMQDSTGLSLRPIGGLGRAIMDTVPPRVQLFFSHCRINWLWLQLSSAPTRSLNIIRPLLPLNFEGPTPPEHPPIFNPPPPQSKEVSAVLWVLETSTDPAMVQIVLPVSGSEPIPNPDRTRTEPDVRFKVRGYLYFSWTPSDMSEPVRTRRFFRGIQTDFGQISGRKVLKTLMPSVQSNYISEYLCSLIAFWVLGNVNQRRGFNFGSEKGGGSIEVRTRSEPELDPYRTEPGFRGGQVQSAAEMVPELQWWPIESDIHPSLKRLADIFNSCFTDQALHTGMEARALACIRAFGVLETFREVDGPTMTRWTLPVIPARQPPIQYLPIVLKHFGRKDSYTRDDSAFADFLFCIISFFRPTSARDRAVQDKSQYILQLTILLFQTLTQYLMSRAPESLVDQAIITDIIARLLLFAGHMPRSEYAPSVAPSCRKAVYAFCATPGISEQDRLWAIRLIRLDYLTLGDQPMVPDTQNVGWVYRSLEKLGSARTRHPEFVGDLLQALYLSQPVQTIPSPDALGTLLWALRLSPDESGLNFGEWEYLVGDGGSGRLRYFAASVLCFADNWFYNPRLGLLLAQDSIWSSLGQSMHPQFVTLGNKLSMIPHWQSIISENLPSWLAYYPLLTTGETVASNEFCAVLTRIWDVDETEAHQLGKEKPLAMVFMALTTAWNTFNFPASSPQHMLNLLESTASMAFFARILHWAVQTPSHIFRDTVMIHLGASLAQAGQRCHSNQHLMVGSGHQGLDSC